LTPAVALSSPELGPALASLEPWLAIALFILYYRHTTTITNTFTGYIASLPSQCTSPVIWTDTELQSLLSGSQLLSSVQSYRSYFQDRYAALQSGLFAQYPDLFDTNTVFTYENFLWAVCSVRARVHPPLEGEQLAVVPLADLTQHRRAANSRWDVKKRGGVGGFFGVGGGSNNGNNNNKNKGGGGGGGGGESLILIAEQAIQLGDPISVDFGPSKTDSQILLDFGVHDSTARIPAFALTVALSEEDRFFADKADILEYNEQPLSGEHLLRGDAAPSDVLLSTLRLLNLGGPDSFLMESIFRNEVWGHMQLPVSQENEENVYQSLINGCKSALAGYSTSIDIDLAALPGLYLGDGGGDEGDRNGNGSGSEGGKVWKERAAISVRLAEKEALDATLMYFESRIDRLQGMEYYADRRLKRLGLLDDQGNSTWDGFFEDGIA